MKKTLVMVTVLALILILALATGCGKTDESGAGASAGGDEEVARGSVSLIDSIDTGGLSLDDVNILDESDEDASFRAGSHQVGEDWEIASAN